MSYTYAKSPAEKARATRLANLCDALVARLTAHAEAAPTDLPGVVAIFAEHRRRADLGDAFQRLDEKPSFFGNGQHCQHWHSMLRQVRNSHKYAHELFALWS